MSFEKCARPFVFLGPLLGRCKEASVALPGGCVIGDRPIDLHLKGFEALGSAVRVEGGDIKVFAPKLTGAQIDMQGKFGPTVLGTDNVMMAAVLADGVTVIEGAACEPEVVDLANFLNKMGAKIEGAGTDRIVIEGVRELHGAEHRVIPDRIEAGTFLVAGAIAGDGVTVKRVEPEHVRAVTDALAKCGYAVDIAERFHFRPAQRRCQRVGNRYGTVSWFPNRHAGANVRVTFDEQRNEFSY